MFWDHLGLIGKVLFISLLLSLGIKYLAPLLSIPATPLTALIPVLGVPGAMALIFWLDPLQ